MLEVRCHARRRQAALDVGHDDGIVVLVVERLSTLSLIQAVPGILGAESILYNGSFLENPWVNRKQYS